MDSKIAPAARNYTFRGRVLETIVAHAREAQPGECCGILVGLADDVIDAIRAVNLSTKATRYLIDPKDHIEARRRARAQGLEVVGFYHSHPHSSPEPSPTDEAEALYDDHLYLIVSLAGGSPEVRLYRLDSTRLVEAPFVVVR